MKRSIGLTFLLAGLATTPAHATPDNLFWQALCSTGAIRACASIMVRTAWTSPTTNVAEVWIRNLQGFDPRDNTGGSVFDSFLLLMPNSPFLDDGGGSVPRVGTHGPVGGSASGWIGDGISMPQYFSYFLNDVEEGQPGDGVQGCAPGPQRDLYLGQTQHNVQTCNALGFTGWATIATFQSPTDFVDPYKWDTSGASFTLYGATHDGKFFQIDFPAGAAVVTPEPSSIVLLASGLVLVGCAVRRRRATGRPSAV